MNGMTGSELESLKGLRDVEGILGSFVLSQAGHVVLRDLPQMFSNDVLADVGPRVFRLRETLSQDGAAAQVVVRYEDHKLILRPLPESSIVVLALHNVNMSQLKMALNLVGRSFSKVDFNTASAVQSHAGESTNKSAPPSARGAYYRGQRIS